MPFSVFIFIKFRERVLPFDYLVLQTKKSYFWLQSVIKQIKVVSFRVLPSGFDNNSIKYEIKIGG